MDKNILENYKSALARTRLLRLSIKKLEDDKAKMNEQGYYVTDCVSRGKKGGKSLGTIIISGFPYRDYKKISKNIDRRKANLMREEQELQELVAGVEGYIAGIDNLEIRNLLTLYYVDDLSWLRVSHKMNEIYDKKGPDAYTENSCRGKVEYFIKNN